MRKLLILTMALLFATSSASFAKGSNIKFPIGYVDITEATEVEMTGWVCTKVSMAMAVYNKTMNYRKPLDLEQAIERVNTERKDGECFSLIEAKVLGKKQGFEKDIRGQKVIVEQYEIIGRKGNFFMAFSEKSC